MANVRSGSSYWNRLVHRLTSDVTELDADDLSVSALRGGATQAKDCRSGEAVTVMGRLRSVDLRPSDTNATVEAELYDGTEGVTLIWFGRRHIAGIEAGRAITARGRIAIRDGKKVLYNPYYELRVS